MGDRSTSLAPIQNLQALRAPQSLPGMSNVLTSTRTLGYRTNYPKEFSSMNRTGTTLLVYQFSFEFQKCLPPTSLLSERNYRASTAWTAVLSSVEKTLSNGSLLQGHHRLNALLITCPPMILRAHGFCESIDS